MLSLEHWLSRIRAALSAGLRGSPLASILHADPATRSAYARSFADDAGHRRVIDPPLLAWVLDIPLWNIPRISRRDVRLWAALTDPTVNPLALLDSPAGPLAPEARHDGIEVWTEIELASLQALWWHSRPHCLRVRRSLRPQMQQSESSVPPAGSLALHRRALEHARWLMAEIQPDNGTNRPWALATFAELAASGDTDATLYAETLLHNCQVALGKPDRLSTILLLDAQQLLEIMLQSSGKNNDTQP